MPSLNTGGYAKARQRLPEAVLRQLFEHTGAVLQAQTVDARWSSRAVKLLDGSNVVMADTPANQACYPQHTNQKAGCGFPMAKLLGAFCLTSGSAIGVGIADFNTSEIALARRWYDSLSANDIVLADRAYGSYGDLALVQQQQADGVFRKHQRRRSDFRRGKRLGKDDHLVEWSRPACCPQGMSRDVFDNLPTSLQVREVRYHIRQAGQRTTTITLVTTLLDAKAYPKTKLAELYGLRWQIETNFDHLKTTLAMEMLKAQSPAMVRKEIYAHLIAYNLLRYLAWQAAKATGQDPLRLSIQGIRQSFNQFRTLLAHAGRHRGPIYTALLLDMVALTAVLDRPNRYEPRRIKRRPKAFPFLCEPRTVMKQRLIAIE